MAASEIAAPTVEALLGSVLIVMPMASGAGGESTAITERDGRRVS